LEKEVWIGYMNNGVKDIGIQKGMQIVVKKFKKDLS